MQFSFLKVLKSANQDLKDISTSLANIMLFYVYYVFTAAENFCSNEMILFAGYG